MTLSDRFFDILDGHEEDPARQGEAADLVLNAKGCPERDGLLALMYHDGIGVHGDLDKCFEYAEKSATGGGDALGYFLLGYMCDNAETPDQKEGGPRQKYDHYDAERFYELCAGYDSRWKEAACLWLGDYYMNMARGGDPEIGVEYYEAVANESAEAAGALGDYYWDLLMPEFLDDEEWAAQLFKWTSVAARLAPDDYLFRLGWIYADGLGCPEDLRKAMKFFEEASSHGDWRGADAMAKILSEKLEHIEEENPKERAALEGRITYWEELAAKLHEEELEDNEKDPDNPIEED